jgi:nucleotide-binding universal stress UspA family protein
LLLHVVPSLSIPNERIVGTVIGMDNDAAGRELHHLGEMLIARALERLRDQTLEGFLHPRTRCLIYDADGQRVLDVMRLTHDENVDLIVLGAHDHSAYGHSAYGHSADQSHALLGHVAERVVHLSSVPLLLVRAGP